MAATAINSEGVSLRCRKRHFQGQILYFNVVERYCDVGFQHSFFLFAKIPFRPSAVLSRLFVAKILPKVCSPGLSSSELQLGCVHV